MRLPSRSTFLALVIACACADPATDDTTDLAGGGKADDIEPADFACQNVSIDGGLSALAEIHDPIADLLLKQGDGCPTNYAEMVAKLRAVDGQGCEEGKDLRTRIVSDDARLVDTGSNFRTFTTRACGTAAEHEMAWTLLSVKANENLGDRSFIEMMAFDPQSSLYNFYTLSGGWNFEGSTIEVLDGSIGCANCHNGGGLIMKELDRPWIHWESDGFDIPGADKLFEAHAPMFGVRGDGEELEALVREGNEAIIDGRIRHHSTPEVGSVRELLRPLFCQVEINLDTAGETPGAPIEQIPADFFIDPHFGVARGVAMPDGVYEEAIASAGQRVQGVSPEPTDTAFKFVYPERSGIDLRYVERLVELGVVDEDFVSDVLAIDFTNPLYSEQRCALLDEAPQYGTPTPAVPPPMPEPGDEPATDPGDCCEAHAGSGCSNPEIEACVCAADPFCCENDFDAACANATEGKGCFDCNGDGELGGAIDPSPTRPSSQVKIAEANPETIRKAFLDALSQTAPARGTAAATLLAHLQNTADVAGHHARVDAFLKSCGERPAEALMRDALRVAHGLRRRTANMAIIEHPEQMPTTNLDDGLVTLDPVTCALPDPV
ncbi:MAG: hypothetical protein AAF721_30030 [Myxococcota bacterium]